MLKKMTFALLFMLTALVMGGFFLPSQYHVERSVEVERPASVIFALLNSYKTFNHWSPWAARDPDAIYAYSGPESGPGARLSWSGDPRTVGEGWQQIIRSVPGQRIDIQMDFGEQGIAQSYFEFSDSGSSTKVTWAFETDVAEGKGVFGSLLGKYFGLFLERWIGSDYEQGLAGFKRYAESLPEADFNGSAIEIVNAEVLEILFVRGQSSQEASDVAQALADAFQEIDAFMTERSIDMAGQPMAITRGWDENGYQFDAAIPVKELPQTGDDNVRIGYSPSGRAVRYTHIGPYDRMLEAYEQLASFMAANGLEEGPVSWEHYISDPGATPAEEIITHIYFLIKE